MRQQALVEAPRECACRYCGEGYGKGFAVCGSVGFRKGRYAHLYNCIVGAISRVDFGNMGDGELRESVFLDSFFTEKYVKLPVGY